MQQTSFWDRGFQYYIAGRFAVPAGLNPIVGNLLHHSIEFLLNGALSKTRTLSGVAPTLARSSADLGSIQSRDRRRESQPVRSCLHDYEDLRYPDDALKNSMGSMISTHRSQLPPEMAAEMGRRRAALPAVREYELCLQDIDELVEAIFTAAKVNPRFFFDRMNPKAREVLVEGNKAAGLLK
jgi:hypothetical protein